VDPRRIPFAKAHALGNDFLLVEQAALADLEPAALALRLCNRHMGIGADGLVVLAPSAVAQAAVRIYNADGSEAMLSGNALRCVATWLLWRGGGGDSNPPGQQQAPLDCIALDTPVGLRELTLLERNARRWIFRTVIGRPSFAAPDVPFQPRSHSSLLREPITDFPLPVGDTVVPVTILSLGNPQCIIFVYDWALVDWKGLGAEIERHPFFPDRTNVGFVQVVADDRVEARFWERGAGHTLASGTGSCACVIAAHLAGTAGRRVTVGVEHGEMQVDWRDDGMVELTGPAEIVAEGIHPWQE